MREFNRYLVTSALPYANGPLHIGHLAGAYLPADVYVRFMRLMGKDIAYICGSDEHGAAITMRALKDGITPQEVVDKYHNMFVDTFDKIGISFDKYHRTSDPLHHETSQEFFKLLYDKGQFDEQESEQYFDAEANMFLADRYIKGTCPKCSHQDAYGDQCESCGSSLSPTELINPISVLTGAVPTLKTTKHWFLKLNEYEDWLKEWIDKGKDGDQEVHYPEEWKNHVIGQCKSWLDGGLVPRSMTRDLDWGVDVPKDIEGSKGKKLYVWMDAPIGYVSATKAWAQENNKNWKDYWQADDSKLIHFIGKDNIVFHCLIFPVILKAHGDYILPYNVPANQFMNLEGKKISTSRNWAVWAHEYVEEFPDKIDELRYNMIRNMPENKDSEFTWKNYQDTNNNELVANLANFVNRIMVLVNKYYEGVVPEIDENASFKGSSGEEYEFPETELLSLHDALQDLSESVRAFDFRGGLKKVMDISTMGNQLLQYNEPWKMIKEDPETVASIMAVGMQYVAALSVACRPFLPGTSDKIRAMINLPSMTENGEWEDMVNKLCEGEHLILGGHQIGSPEHLFSRIDDAVIAGQVSKLEEAQKLEMSKDDIESSAPIKPEITFDDFTKLDIRTATVLEAEKVKKADKLLKLTVDLGFEKRTVVSGIAEHFTPEDAVGKKVSLLVNLAPRKIKGIESNGMILMAENKEGKLSFVNCPEEWDNGMPIA